MMSLPNLEGLVKQISKLNLERKFPHREDSVKFSLLREELIRLLSIDSIANFDSYNFSSLQRITNELRVIYEKYDDSTDLASRARLNEAVAWSYTSNLERAIFLAGIVKDKNIKEPYKSQILNLPANACLQRYRQLYRIIEGIEKHIAFKPINQEYYQTLKQMESSYLNQFRYFSSDAFATSPTYIHSIYHKALSNLMYGWVLSKTDEEKAKYLYESAYELLHNIEKPTSNSHFMHITNCKTIAKEFLDLKRLSEAHPKFTSVLTILKTKAETTEGGYRPKDYFPIMSYVATGTKHAASISGLLLLAYGVANLLGADIHLDDLKKASEDIYNATINLVFRDSEDTLNLARSFVNDPGGLGIINDPGGLAFNQDPGGLAANASNNSWSNLISLDLLA